MFVGIESRLRDHAQRYVCEVISNDNTFQISEALVRQRFVQRCDYMDGQ